MKSPRRMMLLSVIPSAMIQACAPAPPNEEATPQVDEVEAIRQADLAWSAAQASDGLDGTMSVYLDDAVLLPANGPMVVGKDAIRAASAEAGLGSPGYSVSWEPTRIEVAESGELAYAIGTNEGTILGPCGSPIQVKGKVHRDLEEAARRQLEGRSRHVQLGPTSAIEHMRVTQRPPNKAMKLTKRWN